MDLWYPPDDQAPLLEWWTPLLAASAAARSARVPWPIHLDDFVLQGRVDRSGRPAVWVYRHRGSGQELYVDATGQAYKFSRTPNSRSFGRFTACDIRSAVHRAGLPQLVEPVWYDEPPVAPVGWDTPRLPLDGVDDEAGTRGHTWSASERHATRHGPAGGVLVEPQPRPKRRPRAGARRGHLTLLQGGRQAG